MSTKYEYHRNGVSGWPFWVACGNKNLKVSFFGSDEDGPDDHVFKVARELIDLGVRIVRVTQAAVVVKRTERTGVVVWPHTQSNGAGNIMVAVVDLTRPTDRRIAVFDAERLPDVRFFHNSFRGDNFVEFVHKLLTVTGKGL